MRCMLVMLLSWLKVLPIKSPVLHCYCDLSISPQASMMCSNPSQPSKLCLPVLQLYFSRSPSSNLACNNAHLAYQIPGTTQSIIQLLFAQTHTRLHWLLDICLHCMRRQTIYSSLPQKMDHRPKASTCLQHLLVM